MKTVAFMTEMRRAVPTADEESIKEHVETYGKVQEMLEKKKLLLKEYKEIKKTGPGSKLDQVNSLYSKLNSDLGLDQVPKTVRQLSSAAR